MGSVPEAAMRLYVLLVLVLIAEHGGLVDGSGGHYPKLVSWERTDSETFESEPNVLEGVSYFKPSVVSPNAEPKEEHYFTDREIPDGKLDCLDTTKKPQPPLKFMRRDLPGLFLCEKPIFVIPVVNVELGRFFNVSLDFLKLQSAEPIRVLRFRPLPEGLSLEVGPSGIVFVSGIFTAGKGTLTLQLDFRRDDMKKSIYKLKVLFHIKLNEEEEHNQRLIEFKMVPNRKDPTLPEIKEQIKAIKCAAKAVSVAPWSFHDVSLERESAGSLTLRAYSELAEDFCAPDPSKSEPSCEDFAITEILFNNTECQATPNKRSEEKPQVDVTQDTSGSEERYQNDTELDEVLISNNEFVDISVPSTSTSTTTASTRDPGSNTIDPGTPGVRLEPIPPTVLKNEVSDLSVEDPNLKTAMYGMLGLAAIVVFVIFVFLFSRLELCKKKAGYDPVFMARLSDDNAKFV